jgi:ABC-type transporter Mla subunit MlaD
VVTYVANADNYRQKYEGLRNDRNALEAAKESLTNQLNEKIQQKDDLEKSLNNQIAAMKASVGELEAKLNNAEREKAELLERVNKWASITKDFQETSEKQTQLLNSALDDVKQLKAEQTKLKQELEQTSAALLEKTAIIETLETEKRRIIEEKADLQTRLDKLLQAGGRVAAISPPITPERGAAIPAQPATEPIALKCQVSEVDTKSSLATISIGSADGVKEGMKFHVTRGDAFICDILIIDVDTDKAVGVLELVQQPPRVGDNASTNL